MIRWPSPSRTALLAGRYEPNDGSMTLGRGPANAPKGGMWHTLRPPGGALHNGVFSGRSQMEEVAPYASLRDQAVAVPTRAGDAVSLHGQLYPAGGVRPKPGRGELRV